MASEERLISSTAEAYRRGGEGDAYDFFTRQLSSVRKPPAPVDYLIKALFCMSIGLFILSLTLLLVVSTASWPLTVCAVACVLALVATGLGTFAPKRW